MEKDLFSYFDYREFLKGWILSQPKKGRGQRAAIAAAIKSPVSHISQVLSGVSHLSFEQAEEVNEYLGHNEDESEYFLLLVQLVRAGTPKLKKRIESQVQKIQSKRLVLKDRLKVKKTVSSEDQALFYSSWHYAAVHILITIKQYQTKEAIAKYLKVSSRKISEVLGVLVKLGLAEAENGRYTASVARFHLGSDSPMISKHHANWRLQAIQSLDKENFFEDLHYSSVVSISNNDTIKIKNLLVKSIENAKLLISDSPEEELHSLCLDFFKI